MKYASDINWFEAKKLVCVVLQENGCIVYSGCSCNSVKEVDVPTGNKPSGGKKIVVDSNNRKMTSHASSLCVGLDPKQLVRSDEICKPLVFVKSLLKLVKTILWECILVNKAPNVNNQIGFLFLPLDMTYGGIL